MTESREFRIVGAVILLRYLSLFSTLFFLTPALRADPTTFEAITGESAEQDSAWDGFYRRKDHAFGTSAIGFLRTNLPTLRRGRAFVPAMGEGRNAIFLSQNGFSVDGVDLSKIAVDRAVQEAAARRAPIRGVVANLFEYPYPTESYDFVLLSLFYSEPLIPKLKQSLKKGGYLMVYLKRETDHEKSSLAPDEFRVKTEALRKALREFRTIKLEEYRDQGSDVVAALVQKK